MSKILLSAAAALCAAAALAADPSTDFLAVPRLPAAVSAPKIDGYLDETAWSYAGSLPQLIRGNFMGRSGELPPHAFRLAYDDENLYLGFNTRMPGGSSCVEGVARTETMEPDAWGAEAWEFFVTRGEHMYRFAGNYAGGTCESKYPEFGIKWNGKWTWAFSKAMNIDDSVLWQGEIAIPWKTLDSEGPFDGEIRFNFCRSWTLPTCGTISSFNSAGRGYTPSGIELPRCPWATFDGSAAYRLVSRTDPARGEYAETYELSSVKGGPVAYEAAIVAQDGKSAPKVLHRFETTLPPGGVTNVSFTADTSELGYDAIVRTLRDGGRETMRETVPYDLDRRVFDVTPLYLKEKVRVTFRRPFDGRFEAVGPDGQAVFARACSGKTPFEFAFPRGNAAGTYVFRLVAADGSVAGEEKSDYPGIGDWERQDPHHDWVLPPYEPLRAKVSSDAVDATLSMRRYVWRRSYLPVAMTSQGEELLVAPPEVLLGDERIGDAALAVTSNSATHVGFTAKGESAIAAAENAAWLEYDGVQYNRMTVTPRVAGRALSIRYRLGPAFAKYLHASAGGQWGSKRTEKIPDGESVVGAFPILWTGNEEKGLCFFYQSRTGWTAKKENTYRLEKSADGFTVTVAVAENLPAGKPFAFEFGFVASPARPLAPNYPYDTLHGSSGASHLNRPDCPVQDVVLMTCPVMRSGDLGSYFCDLDDVEYFRKNLEMHRWTMEKHIAGETVRPVPYTCARFLSSYYPEVRAFLPEWTFGPECALDYSHTGHFLYECCPASSATDFFIWKYKTLLRLIPGLKGIYLDFGLIHECSNKEHGCHESMAILGQREFYRRLCVAQIEAGITNPVVVIHSTDCVQLPAMTFVTHLFNGEHVRQMSSTLLHDKKDILDTYGIEMFACELSTQPWGMSNSIYMPYDTLEAKNGGDEPTDAYEFRMGLASIGAGLVHNTVQSLHRNHYGLFDKVIRAFRGFGVGSEGTRFVGYWRNPVKVVRGRNAYVSCHTDGKKVLAVIAHIGREHEDQDLELELDPSVLGLSAPLGKATDLLSADDPDYRWLYERKKDRTLDIRHAPLDLGDFGTKVLGFDGRTLRFHLPFHRFALVELTP